MHWSPIGPDFEGRGRGREPASVSHKGRLKQVRDRHQTWVSRRFQHWPPDLDHRFGTRDTLPTNSVRGAWKEKPQASPAPVPHSQALQSPPFPAPVQAPPPSPHWLKAQATLIGQEGEDVSQKTRPRALIGLGRHSPRSGSVGVPERCRCLPVVHQSSLSLPSRRSAARRDPKACFSCAVAHIHQTRGTHGGCAVRLFV